MNKAELIAAIAAYPAVADKKTAAAVLEATLAEIQAAVTKGDRVSLTGFGVFERRARKARTARNPRTGEVVAVAKTTVPAFRPGAGFKATVSTGKPQAAPAKKKGKKPGKGRGSQPPLRIKQPGILTGAKKGEVVKKATKTPARRSATGGKAVDATGRMKRADVQKIADKRGGKQEPLKVKQVSKLAAAKRAKRN